MGIFLVKKLLLILTAFVTHMVEQPSSMLSFLVSEKEHPSSALPSARISCRLMKLKDFRQSMMSITMNYVEGEKKWKLTVLFCSFSGGR
jgi:hypothetical protein